MKTKSAPPFFAYTTGGRLNFPADVQGKICVIYFFDSTFCEGCVSDILALQEAHSKLASYGAKVIALTNDSLYAAIAFALSLQNHKKDGLALPFEIASVKDSDVFKKYGVGKGQKALVITNAEGEIFAFHNYCQRAGINTTEAQRLVLALQKSQQDNVQIPANWLPGEPVLMPSPKTLEDAKTFISKTEQNGGFGVDWYICYQS